MTPAEFKAKAKDKLRAKQYQELVWGDITSVIGTAPQAAKDKIVGGIKNENPAEVGRVVLYLIEQQIKASVDTELDSIIADGQLSLNEFSRIFD